MKRSEEVCACGSKELDIWKRSETERGRSGRLLWFAECMSCGNRGDGRTRTEAVTGLTRPRPPLDGDD